MNILHMVDVPWDSGLAHYALTLAAGQKARGHRVWVSTIPGQKPWAKAHRLGVPTVPLATWKSVSRLRSFLRENRVEIVNAHTGATHSVAVMAATGGPAAVIRTRSDARRVRKSFGSGFLYRRTARVIAAADYIRQDFLLTLDLSPDHVVTIPQGIDTVTFRPSPLPEPPIVGIVARLDPVKGHRYLLEAVAMLRPHDAVIRLKVAGQPENVKLSELKALAGRLGVEPYVDFLGFQPDISKVMQTCTIGVIASTGSEAVSRVALEWMASGRPVVATRVGCLPEVVRDRETGVLVEPESAGALAEGLSRLLNDPTATALMAQRARQRAEEKFSLPVVLEQTEKVYAQAMNEAHAC